MAGWGVLLVILGAGSLLLPRIGLGFLVTQPLEALQPVAGVIVGLLGLALIVVGVARDRGRDHGAEAG
jgi:hypothetical protein